MQHLAQWTEIESGKRKFVHHWQNGSAAAVTVCVVHGLGEHGGRYHRLAADFAAAGFSVFAFDQQGHGRSPEDRGCVKSYAALLADIAAFQNWCLRQNPHLPVVLFGHSMGGNLVLNYALRYPQQPSAVISSSPMLKAVRHPGWLFERLARVAMWLAPNYRLRSEVIPERLMSDPVEQQLLNEDALFHSQLSLRLGAGLLDSGAWALRNAQRLKACTLLTHGTQDYLTSLPASVEFAHRAGSVCQLNVLEGQLHDPFRDKNREKVIAQYVDFIKRSANGEGC